jgi:hypothetical protein
MGSLFHFYKQTEHTIWPQNQCFPSNQLSRKPDWQRLMAIARRKTPLAYVVLLCGQSTTPIFRLLRLYREKITTPPLCPALPLDLCDPGLAFSSAWTCTLAAMKAAPATSHQFLALAGRPATCLSITSPLHV